MEIRTASPITGLRNHEVILSEDFEHCKISLQCSFTFVLNLYWETLMFVLLLWQFYYSGHWSFLVFGLREWNLTLYLLWIGCRWSLHGICNKETRKFI